MDCSSAPFTFFRALHWTMLATFCPLLIFLTLGRSKRSNGSTYKPLFGFGVKDFMNVSTMHLHKQTMAHYVLIFKLTGFPSMFCHHLSFAPALLRRSRLEQPDKKITHNVQAQPIPHPQTHTLPIHTASIAFSPWTAQRQVHAIMSLPLLESWKLLAEQILVYTPPVNALPDSFH